MSVCSYMKRTGEMCGRPHGPEYTACAGHRSRAASRPVQPCASCGKLTKRPSGLCIGRTCGWSMYRQELALRKKAAAAEALAASIADRRAERLAEDAAEELFAALEGSAEWPSWIGMSREAFEAEGDREADRLAAERAQQDAEAALVAALVAAEAEAAAAAERDRAAREQLDRLRRALAGRAANETPARDISPPR